MTTMQKANQPGAETGDHCTALGHGAADRRFQGVRPAGGGYGQAPGRCL